MIFGACQSAPVATEINVPILFSDHMVMQRNDANLVWGTATPGGKVSILFQDLKAETVAAEDSTWEVILAPKPAGGPFSMSIIGQDTLVIEDILMGDVWLGSGQSNMQWSVRQSADAEAEIARANYPNIRLFSVDRVYAATPRTNIPSDGWHLTSPETVADFSAVAYYFGRSLHDSLDIPIGLIHSSWGGTVAEAWTSAETLRELPDFLPAIEALEEQTAAYGEGADAYEMMMQEWTRAVELNDAGHADGNPMWADAAFDASDWSTMNLPVLWEDGYLPNFDGIVWFRKTFSLPANWTGNDLNLNLSMIDDIDITWVNGVEVGSTQQYNKHRMYTIPASALKAGENVISVRVVDTGGGGGIYGEADAMYLARGEQSNNRISLAGDWTYRESLSFSDPSLPPRPSGQQNTPSVLFNAMIHPLIPYQIKGVIWYQGESNAGRAYQYRTLFPALISDWRKKWNSSFSFHFVQLANFQAPQQNPSEAQNWPELREAQTMTLAVPLTGMAVIADIGEADDIHPTNKQDVGARLAQAALSVTYNKDHVAGGPLFKDVVFEGRVAKVSFDQVGGGLASLDDAPLRGFAIAGPDSVFHWADAAIEEDQVHVSSTSVSEPVAVRYGWANNPIITLYNAEGIPASPFRTDDWPGITINNR